MIIADCEDAFEAYNDVRVYIIGYEVNNAKFLKTYNGHTDMYAYCSNIGEVRAALNSVTYVQTSEYCNRGAAFTKMINEVVFRDNAGKFVFQIMNGSTTVNANYFSELDACARGNINYSEVMPSGYHYISSEYGASVDAAITNTGGLNLTYGSDTEVKIYEHIVDNIAPPHIEFNVILPTGWKDISLVDVISPDNYAKSDSDDFTDREEIDTESGLITWDNNGNIQLPTFKKCLEVAADRGYNVINEYNNTVPSYMRSYFYNEEILPIHSNPCDEDSDGDELMLALKNLDEFSGIIKCTDDIQSQIKTLIRNADTIEEIEKLNQPKLWAKLSTNVGINENLVVLGRYGDGGATSYLSIAKKMNATYFNNPYYDDLEKVITKMDDDAMWKINEEFLKSQTQAGKTIIFSHNPHDLANTIYKDELTSFGKEIKYLEEEANYKISGTVNADGYYFAVPK